MTEYEKLLAKFKARYKSLEKLNGFENKARAKQAKRAYLDLKKVVDSQAAISKQQLIVIDYTDKTLSWV